MHFFTTFLDPRLANSWLPFNFDSGLNFGFALVIVISFALVAWGMRSVTAGGAVSGALVAFVLYAGSGGGGFLTLVAVFLLTAVSTRFGHLRVRSGAKMQGGRTASQVFANLGAAAFCALPLLFVNVTRSVLLAGMVAALCEAAADTVSGEVGQVLGRRTVVITTWKPTDAGQNGGISLAGTLAGIAAASVVAVVAVLGQVIFPSQFILVTGLGVAGMFLDSVLGATLERPGRLGNDSVNFTGSSFAAFAAVFGSYLAA